VIRRLVEKPGIVFVLVFAWKVALLLFTAQPVPNNDSFFYDGPVVNYLLHGKYCNPSLVQALPISGGEVFCAYPPLYQAFLLGWMGIFGTSALSAMWLHLSLLGAYFLIVLAIFRQLRVPGLVVNLAGLFLFGITFHDRPDTVAHVLGALAVLGLVRGDGGRWLTMVALLLAFCASLQIGGVYLLWCGLVVIGNVWTGNSDFPWVAVVVGGLTVAGLVALVKFGYPQLWSGFQEHARLTPSVTGWRVPGVLDGLKAVRTAPAIFVVVAGMILAGLRKQVTMTALKTSPAGMITISGTLSALALIGVSLVVLTPNTIHIANYVQPIVVGGFLSSGLFFSGPQKPSRALFALFFALSLVTGVRAIGMTTWGVLCARDVSYAQATSRVRAEVDALPPGSTVIASAAYLYDLANRTNITWIHNDWPAPPDRQGMWEYHAFAGLRPQRVVVTQFDFYRRYGAIFEQLRSHPDLASLRVTNTAGVRAPDSFPQMQRIVQHLSWAPVIAEFSWK
jgi:hypothetical protein